MDRISTLPDDVLCHILSFLPTKHAVATSILSQRWVNLWSFLPTIDLDDSLYLNPSRKGSNPVHFIRFIDRVLSLNQSHTLVKFRLYMLHNYMQDLCWVNGIIQKVFSRNVVEFDLKLSGVFFDKDDYCLKIPHSQSLKVLKVNTRYLMLMLPAFPGCFPSLRVFDVNVALDEGNEWITNLFPCLPALQKLCLVGDLTVSPQEFCFNIGGAALKHVEVELFIYYDHYECDAMVVIDAPKLEYLRLQDGLMASYVVKNKPEIREVRLDMELDGEFLDDAVPTRLMRFSELLQGLVNAKFIWVSSSTLEVVSLQKWNLPMLPYLRKLELEVYTSWIRMLHWLESCPNLKALSLIIMNPSEESEEEVTHVVPSCLSSHVKEIEIKRLGMLGEEELLRYLLYNAKVLDRFTIDSHVYIKDGILQ